MTPSIESFMTPVVHTIRSNAPLSDAHAVMREHHIRHLPVLEGGALVGMVSERDMHLVESLGVGKANEITVEEAMSQDVLVVEPTADLSEVARLMAERKAGSAVVVHDQKVKGIFTTQDALWVLAKRTAQHSTAQTRERRQVKSQRPAHSSNQAPTPSDKTGSTHLQPRK
jgi:acetoin utilization protein AcuB